MTRPARLLALALTLAACSTSARPATGPPTSLDPGPSSTTGGVVQPTPDPFIQYQGLVASWKITDAPALTPDDDALARAVLGCQTTWPPRTVDAALAVAYSDVIASYRAQGHCG